MEKWCSRLRRPQPGTSSVCPWDWKAFHHKFPNKLIKYRFRSSSLPCMKPDRSVETSTFMASFRWYSFIDQRFWCETPAFLTSKFNSYYINLRVLESWVLVIQFIYLSLKLFVILMGLAEKVSDRFFQLIIYNELLSPVGFQHTLATSLNIFLRSWNITSDNLSLSLLILNRWVHKYNSRYNTPVLKAVPSRWVSPSVRWYTGNESTDEYRVSQHENKNLMLNNLLISW